MTTHAHRPHAVRPERADDREVIRTVLAAAFDDDGETAGLVDSLRNSSAFIPDLSLVATLDDVVVGHVLVTRAELVDEGNVRHRALVLSPLSVLPEHQRQSIGATLVRCALAGADATGEQVVVLQGSPRYYPRFGFRDSRTLGISMELPDWAPPEAGMAYPLAAYEPSVRGRLLESQPFLDLAGGN